jgi:hypothetical protein
LAGRYVAYERYASGTREDDHHLVRVLDLATGRTRSTAASGDRTGAGDGATTALRVTAKGVAAWIARDRQGTLVVELFRAGLRTELDEGPQIDPRSLAVSTTRIYWINGGTPKTSAI